MACDEKFEDKWKFKHAILDGGLCCMSVALFECEKRLAMGIRWEANAIKIDADGNEYVQAESLQGNPTDWTLLPYDFAVVIGKELILKRVAGFSDFNEEGLKCMVKWLLTNESISDAMCF